MTDIQNLAEFKLPSGFRGRSAFVVQMWWVMQRVFFNNSPQFMYGFRRFLLRIFGAKIGQKVLIRPSAKITYPWKVSIGDYAWIGDDVVLYSLGEITIGHHAVVSQKSYLCAADHDYRDSAFGIRARPISIGCCCWVATDVYIGPGVRIGNGTVVGARSSVFKDLSGGLVCYGNPCKEHGVR